MLSTKTKRSIARAIKYVMEESPDYTTGDPLSSSTAAIGMFRLHLMGKEREHFVVAFLTTEHKLIAMETMFSGTIAAAQVHPREIAKRALQLNAAAVILGHNHPSGSTTPSTADLAITKKIKECLTMLGVSTLDHIIVGASDTHSMASHGEI